MVILDSDLDSGLYSPWRLLKSVTIFELSEQRNFRGSWL